MRKRRRRTAVTLIAMGVVLLVSIAVGQRVGEKALFGETERRTPLGGVLATPVPNPTPSIESVSRYWKREQVVSVATDPAFPDPRVTPPPTPTPKPPPRPRATPPPTPIRVVPDDQLYTSPPLPMPLVSHEPEVSATTEPLPTGRPAAPTPRFTPFGTP